MAKETKFFPYEEVSKRAKALFKRERKKLRNSLPWSHIEHVGSTAIPGALTKKDLDIQIRVNAADFKKTIIILKIFYEEHHPKLWNDNFAIFKKDDDDFPIDLMVTVLQSSYDDFYKIRDYLIKNPRKLAEYNELKVKNIGKDYQEYVKAKQNFFGGNGQGNFLKNK